MNTRLPRVLQMIAYEREAEEYLKSLPPEHFMEATSQATQRKITLESLDLVHARRPDVQSFNELLIQYLLRDGKTVGKVVPDNMVVVHDRPIRASGSYNVPLQPVGPFWVLEYISKSNPRKDYEESYQKYERDLRVPYYLTFYPDESELTLYRHNKRRYVTVKPNEQGRYAIPELELEMGLLDGWVRFWFRGELLPLPAELQRNLDEARRQLTEQTQRADDLQRQLESVKRQLAEAKARLRERPS
jgi:Uma2 family endonuclease